VVAAAASLAAVVVACAEPPPADVPLSSSFCRTGAGITARLAQARDGRILVGRATGLSTTTTALGAGFEPVPGSPEVTVRSIAVVDDTALLGTASGLFSLEL
jgi:hypothetical protein